MNKRIIIFASVFGILAVLLGAFGAHSLKELISAKDLVTWNTAVQYQFYHTLALLNVASWFFSFGILLFSGSLYLLSVKTILNITNINFLGPLTPIGGLLFILGWISLLVATIKNK